jgi:hypothetical protein
VALRRQRQMCIRDRLRTEIAPRKNVPAIKKKG